MKEKIIRDMIRADDKVLLIRMLQEENKRLIFTLEKIKNILKSVKEKDEN